MDVVHNTTQNLRADISKEDLGKYRLDFGDAGEDIGNVIYKVQNSLSEQQNSVSEVGAPQFDVSLPQVQQAPSVDVRKYTKEMEDLIRLKNNGGISDVEFQNRESDIKDKMYYSGAMSPKDITTTLSSIPGYSELAKDINVGYVMAERAGANEAIKDKRKEQMNKAVKIARLYGVDPDMPIDKQAEIGNRFIKEQEVVSLPYKNIQDFSRGDKQFEVAFLKNQKVALYDILYASAQSVYRSGLQQGANPHEVYKAVVTSVNATVRQYGKDPAVVQGVMDAVINPYKKWSEGDNQAGEAINKGLDIELQNRKNRYLLQLDNITEGGVAAAEALARMNIDISTADTELLNRLVQARSDLSQIKSISMEDTQKLILAQATNGDNVQDVDMQAVNSSVIAQESGKFSTPQDVQIQKGNREYYIQGLRKAMLQSKAMTGKIDPRIADSAKTFLANQMYVQAIDYNNRLPAGYSLDVDSTGRIVAMRDGKVVSSNFLGRQFSTDDAEAEKLANELNSLRTSLDLLPLSKSELKGLLPTLQGTAPTTGDYVEAATKSAYKWASEDLLGSLQATPRAAKAFYDFVTQKLPEATGATDETRRSLREASWTGSEEDAAKLKEEGSKVLGALFSKLYPPVKTTQPAEQKESKSIFQRMKEAKFELSKADSTKLKNLASKLGISKDKSLVETMNLIALHLGLISTEDLVDYGYYSESDGKPLNKTDIDVYNEAAKQLSLPQIKEALWVGDDKQREVQYNTPRADEIYADGDVPFTLEPARRKLRRVSNAKADDLRRVDVAMSGGSSYLKPEEAITSAESPRKRRRGPLTAYDESLGGPLTVFGEELRGLTVEDIAKAISEYKGIDIKMSDIREEIVNMTPEELFEVVQAYKRRKEKGGK